MWFVEQSIGIERLLILAREEASLMQNTSSLVDGAICQQPCLSNDQAIRAVAKLYPIQFPLPVYFSKATQRSHVRYPPIRQIIPPNG